MGGVRRKTLMSKPDTAGTVTLSLTDDGQVATIVIDRRAKHNALTMELLAELQSHLTRVMHSDARVIILRTAGSKVFCVGADIAAFSRLPPIQMWRKWAPTGHQVFDQLARIPQPTIAVVDGIAVGGGLELALACDFRIANDSARFGLPETGLGTIPGWGGTQRLTHLIGTARAKELILARRQIDAATAASWGMVTTVVPAEEMESEISQLVDNLLGSAPIAQQVSKQLIEAAAANAPAAILESLASGLTAHTEDFSNGVLAFQTKTTPTFTGL
jgi:enoyl-CoA hydratase